MGYEYQQHKVTDEDRREFLKALGITGALGIGGVSLNEVRQQVPAESTEEFASIGQSIESDLTSSLDAQFLASQQATFAEQASALPAVAERGVSESEPGDAFESVAAAGRPIYDHLLETGFFESTTTNLPEFTPELLLSSAQAFVGSEPLVEPLTDLGFSEEVGVDFLVPVVERAERLSHYHWVATDEIPRSQLEFGEAIPDMTRAATGGVLLWLEDLDHHLWQKAPLITDEIVSNSVWDGQAMAAGVHLMAEGAKSIGADSSEFSSGDLGALLTTSFAMQAIGQALLPHDAYWITDEMRAPRS